MFGQWFRKKSKAVAQHELYAFSPQQIVELGLAHHQAARLGKAAEAYRKVLEIEPNNFDALHF